MQSYQRFQHVGHTDFNTSGTNGPRLLSLLKLSTHSPAIKESHTAAHTPKHGRFGWGVVSLPSERSARFGNPAWPGVRTAYFAALGSWPGGALEERRKPSGQRCAYACRCPEGVAAPLGCVIFLYFGDVAVFSLCAQYFLNVQGEGWYHYPRCALRVAETLDSRLSKRLICRFLRSGSLH